MENSTNILEIWVTFGISIGAFALIILTLTKGIPWLLKKNETKIIRGNHEKLISYYISEWKLSNENECQLVRLAETSKMHRKILKSYRFYLRKDAAKILIDSNLFKEFLKGAFEYDFIGENFSSLLVEKANSDEKYLELLEMYVQKYRMEFKTFDKLKDDYKLRILKGYCKNSHCGSDFELFIIERAENDNNYKEILDLFIKEKNRYGSVWNRRFQHEQTLVERGSIDVIKTYHSIVGKFERYAQIALFERTKTEKNFKELLFQEAKFMEDYNRELIIAYSLENEEFVDILGQLIETRRLDEEQEIILVENAMNNEKYMNTLRSYIKKYGLQKRAEALLSTYK